MGLGLEGLMGEKCCLRHPGGIISSMDGVPGIFETT